MSEKIYLGYPSVNHTLRKEHILINRTIRQATIHKLNLAQKNAGIKRLQELFCANVDDLLKIIEWNVKNKIHFYRISSGIAPHITNPEFLPRDARASQLVYDMHVAAPILRRIGEIARGADMRLTFHPGLHVALSSPNPKVITAAIRDLWYHYKILKLLGSGGAIVLHGGGRYDDKQAAMRRWVHIYTRIPARVRALIVLENDERNYSIDDVLQISASVYQKVKQYVPIVFDIFHYACYEIYALKENLPAQTPIAEILPKIVATWSQSSRIKIHLAEQMPDARMGTHAAYVETIPQVLLDFPRKFHRPLDLMIESTAHELALLYLRRKYPQTM